MLWIVHGWAWFLSTSVISELKNERQDTKWYFKKSAKYRSFDQIRIWLVSTDGSLIGLVFIGFTDHVVQKQLSVHSFPPSAAACSRYAQLITRGRGFTAVHVWTTACVVDQGTIALISQKIGDISWNGRKLRRRVEIAEICWDYQKNSWNSLIFAGPPG